MCVGQESGVAREPVGQEVGDDGVAVAQASDLPAVPEAARGPDVEFPEPGVQADGHLGQQHQRLLPHRDGAIDLRAKEQGFGDARLSPVVHGAGLSIFGNGLFENGLERGSEGVV